MFLYGIILTNGRDHIFAVVMAEGHFNAGRKAKEYAETWDGFDVYSVSYLNNKKLESGEVVFVGG